MTTPADISVNDTPETPVIPRERFRIVLNALLDIANLAGSELGLEAGLQRIVGIATEAMGAQAGSIYLLDDTGDRLVMRRPAPPP